MDRSEEILTEIRKLQTFVEPLVGRMGAFEGRFDSLEARFDSLEARFDSLEARFDSLEARLARVEAELASTRRTVSTLATQLADFGRLLDLVMEEQRRLAKSHDELSRRIDELALRVEGLGERLSKMLAAQAQARTEDVTRFLAFEERLFALEQKN